MYYVYLLRSESRPEKTYAGFSTDLRSRLRAHNQDKSTHTARFGPWRLEVYVAFVDETRAPESERYLKTSSGKAFAAKRFWPLGSGY